MARTLFFRMVLRKFMENTNNKSIFSQRNIFHKYKCFFFQSVFWSLFNHRQKGQSNQEQCSLYFHVLLCSHCGRYNTFQHIFVNQKKSEYFGPYCCLMIALLLNPKYTELFRGFLRMRWNGSAPVNLFILVSTYKLNETWKICKLIYYWNISPKKCFSRNHVFDKIIKYVCSTRTCFQKFR